MMDRVSFKPVVFVAMVALGLGCDFDSTAENACENVTCPPGTSIAMDASSTSGCSGGGSVSYNPLGGSVTVQAKCFASGSCKYICYPPNPCAKLELWTTTSYSCDTPCLGCGDGVCCVGENHENCSADCLENCGDKTCNGSENVNNCPADCYRDACSGVTCSDHGRCEIFNSQPYCVCDEGYEADGLECEYICAPRQNTRDCNEEENAVYWKDGCGNFTDEIDACEQNEICLNKECKLKTDCLAPYFICGSECCDIVDASNNPVQVCNLETNKCCIPSCVNKECGSNGCGKNSACGTCDGENEVCDDASGSCLDCSGNNECPKLGDKQCVASDGSSPQYRECVKDADDDPCLEWSDIRQCEGDLLCIEGGCVSEECASPDLVCNANSLRCQDNQLQKCNSTGCGWAYQKSCDCGCDPETLDCVPTECPANQYQCTTTVRERCDSKGCGWDEVETCACGCDSGDCVDKICGAGATKCNGAVELLGCSVDGCLWEHAENCTCGCANNNCVAPACTANDYKCEGGVRSKCGSDGCAWSWDSDCACGCNGPDCKAQTCTPNTYKCEGGIRYKCASDGCSWVWQQNCDCGCSGTSCKSKICTPGQSTCSSSTFSTCSSDGCSETDTNCTNGCTTSGCMTCAQSCSGCCSGSTGTSGTCRSGTSDSYCGSGGEICDSCSSTEDCSGGNCIPSCSASNYWSPSSDSDTDTHNQGPTGITTNVPITVTVKQDSKGLQVQVCKDDGNFAENVYFLISDQLGDGAAYFDGTLSTKGNRCSSWFGLSSDTGYDENDWFGGSWFLVSPSTAEASWGLNCTNHGSTGLCWWGQGINLQRTCL